MVDLHRGICRPYPLGLLPTSLLTADGCNSVQTVSGLKAQILGFHPKKAPEGIFKREG